MPISNEILDKIKQVEPMHFPNAFPKIFSWDGLELLLNLRPFVNSSRCKVISGKEYSWGNQTWLSDINTFPPTLLNNEIKEYVCYLSDASRVNEQINSICKKLEDTFPGSAADAHIYFCLSDNLTGGFGIHWDYSHNLIVQTEGRSRLEIWDIESFDESERNVRSLFGEPAIDVVLNPGDAVFVPKHYYHRATSETKRLSVSFPVCFNSDCPKQDRFWIKLPL